MKLFIRYLIVVFCYSTVGAIEHSIIPAMEHFEMIQNISPKKYASNQYSKILAALTCKEDRIRIASYNILFNIDDHKLAEENRWAHRLPRIVAMIEEMNLDILAVQELYADQLNDLQPLLQPSLAFFGQLDTYGEMNGIFYRKNRFELIDHHIWFLPNHSTIHISETLTMVQLKDTQTGKEFAVFNTHLPFSTPDERERHARFIIEQMTPVAAKMAVMLTGDLNTFPNWLDLKKLPFLDGDNVCSILSNEFLKDAMNCSLIGHVGPLSTYSNTVDDIVPFKGTGMAGVLLDHIFVSHGAQVIIHAVQSGTVDGHFPSDHFPVVADVLINPL